MGGEASIKPGCGFGFVGIEVNLLALASVRARLLFARALAEADVGFLFWPRGFPAAVPFVPGCEVAVVIFAGAFVFLLRREVPFTCVSLVVEVVVLPGARLVRL